MAQSHKTLRLFTAAAVAAGISPQVSTAAMAQSLATPAASTDAASDEESSSSAEILVTARRREERLADVPIAITAIGAADIANRQIRSEMDVQNAVPGVIIREYGSNNLLNYVIRGQTVDSYTSSPPAVGTYLNEISLPVAGSSNFFDFESIQVLKGPQGTLFGRNTTGGAVLYETTDPGSKLTGYLRGSLGNYDSRRVEGAVTVPLAESLAIRLAGTYSENDGYVKNLYDGGRFGNSRNEAGRITIKFSPSSNFTNILKAQITDDDGTSAPGEMIYANACGSPLSVFTCFFDPSNPIFQALLAADPNQFPGGVAAYPAFQKSVGPWKTYSNTSNIHTGKTKIISNISTWAVGEALTLKNIIGYIDSKTRDILDYDGTAYGLFENFPGVGQVNDTEQFSNEFQIQGEAFDERLTFTVGVYYLHERFEVSSKSKSFDLSPLAPAALVINYHTVRYTDSYAAFAQGTFALADRLNLTAGLRYSKDDIEMRNAADSIFGAATQRRSDDKPSWTVSLDYKPTASTLLYLATRGSWRGGGFNSFAPPIPGPATLGGNTFEPETTRDVEAGVKFNGDLAGTPALATLAVYNQWISNVQRSNFATVDGVPGLSTVNIPKAEITGVEASLSVRPAPWLELGGQLAYTDARFTSNEVVTRGVTSIYGPYADTPKWSGSAYIQLHHDLGDEMGELAYRAEVYKQSGLYYASLSRQPVEDLKLKGYGLVNMRLSWDDIYDTGLSISAFGRNIGNKRYYTGGIDSSTSLGFALVSPGRPRMYGVEVGFKF